MGTPDFATCVLKKIVEQGKHVAAVVTAPDKPAGRGKKIKQSSVKKYAIENNLPVLQPKNLKDPGFVEELSLLKPDLFIVVAFRMLPEVVWSMPPKGTVNLHASLLPDYRGAAPINWAIINGETKTGVTTFFIEKDIDTGKVIHQEEVAIFHGDTAGDLHDRLMVKGADLVIKSINDIERDAVTPIDQAKLLKHHTEVNAAPKIQKEDCRIDWNKPVGEVYNFIRGLSPYPSAWTIMKHDDSEIHFKVLTANRIEETASNAPGTIETDEKNFLNVYTANGKIQIIELQQEGKKRMKTVDFLKGFRFKKNNIFI
jgi:methionyl-tRNA formyltransferase